MSSERIPYIKADDDVIINEKHIRWVKKINDCMEICSKQSGCSLNNNGKETHKVCKINNLESFLRLDKKFNR